jgi:hypothetical protein
MWRLATVTMNTTLLVLPDGPMVFPKFHYYEYAVYLTWLHAQLK